MASSSQEEEDETVQNINNEDMIAIEDPPESIYDIVVVGRRKATLDLTLEDKHKIAQKRNSMKIEFCDEEILLRFTYALLLPYSVSVNISIAQQFNQYKNKLDYLTSTTAYDPLGKLKLILANAMHNSDFNLDRFAVRHNWLHNLHIDNVYWSKDGLVDEDRPLLFEAASLNPNKLVVST